MAKKKDQKKDQVARPITPEESQDLGLAIATIAMKNEEAVFKSMMDNQDEIRRKLNGSMLGPNGGDEFLAYAAQEIAIHRQMFAQMKEKP